MGESLKNLLPVFVVSALMLSACGAPGATATSSSAAPSSAGALESPVDFASIEPEAVVDTETETCERLNSGGDDSVFMDLINTMTSLFNPGPVESVTPEQRAKVYAASENLATVASTANPEMKKLLDDANGPFETLKVNDFDAKEVYVDTFKTAATELLKRCPPPVESDTTTTPTPTPRPTPKPTAKPKPKPAPVEKVTYEVESNGSIDLITYTHFIGGATAQEQASGPLYGKIQKNYTFKSAEMYRQYSFWSLGVSGMAGADATTITCRILLNGKVISQQTSTGPYANVMCNKGDNTM